MQGEPLAFARVPSTWLVQHAGLPVLVAGDSGANLTARQGVDEGLVQRALQVLLDHLSRFEQRITVRDVERRAGPGKRGPASARDGWIPPRTTRRWSGNGGPDLDG